MTKMVNVKAYTRRAPTTRGTAIKMFNSAIAKGQMDAAKEAFRAANRPGFKANAAFKKRKKR